MTLDPRIDSELTLETIDRVEDVCTVFETKWRTGERQSIEDLVAHSAGLERAVLLRELLAVELEHRALAGECPVLDDYVRRFPADRDIVFLTFREADRLANRDREPDTSIVNGHECLPLALPRRFGEYELIEEIARGGMGIVFKARQVHLNRVVAVKMLLSGQFASDVEIERFYVEAQATAALDHPNIVPIFEVGQSEGQRFFSMGFVDGSSLAQRIAAGSLPPREAAEMVLTVAEALQYAHSRGIIHRDLKPANILIDATGLPHVSDFGLAKRADVGDRLTVTGQMIGTPSFMAPEQATSKPHAIGAVTDVYSLGAVLYSMLTGRPPFQAASVVDTVKQVVEQEPLAPRELDPTIPRDLETIVLKCLEKNLARRYRSAQELADELRRFLAGDAILARPVRSAERAYRWCRRNPAIAGLTALVGLLLLAVAITSTVAALRISGLRDHAVAQQVKADTERVRAERNLQYAHQMIRQLADSYSLLGDQQPQFDDRLQWYEKAHSLLDRVARESPPDTELQTQLAGSFGRLGQLHARAGQSAHAAQSFERAVGILDRLRSDFPQVPQYERDYAKACNFLGRQHRLDNQLDAAGAMHRKACSAQEHLVLFHPQQEADDRRDLATYFSDLGATQRDMNKIADSEVSSEQARRWLEPLVAQNPSDANLQLQLAIVYRSYGAHRTSKGFKNWLNRGREILEAIVQRHPENSGFRYELAIMYSTLARREDEAALALPWERKAYSVLERLTAELPADPAVTITAVVSERDEAGYLKLVGHHREVQSILTHALTRLDVVAKPDAAERYADIEVQVLGLLARSDLRLGNSAAYRRLCEQMVDRCRRRNCYESDALRACLLLPDAVDDASVLVSLAMDAGRQGSRTLRKRANIGGALYRAGQYEESVRLLKTVYESNRMALLAKLGTAEIVRADNARVAVFAALASARLGEVESAQRWFGKARQWLKNEGSIFTAPPQVSSDQEMSYVEMTQIEPASHATGDEISSPNASGTDSRDADARVPELEDRMFLADIAFEVQLLLDEAATVIDGETD